MVGTPNLYKSILMIFPSAGRRAYNERETTFSCWLDYDSDVDLVEIWTLHCRKRWNFGLWPSTLGRDLNRSFVSHKLTPSP